MQICQGWRPISGLLGRMGTVVEVFRVPRDSCLVRIDGEHIFTIKRLDADRVRFTQREIFTGIFVPFRARRLDRDTRRGFKEMNQALKKRAEQSRSSD